jgi:hypothetical protein
VLFAIVTAAEADSTSKRPCSRILNDNSGQLQRMISQNGRACYFNVGYKYRLLWGAAACNFCSYNTEFELGDRTYRMVNNVRAGAAMPAAALLNGLD